MARPRFDKTDPVKQEAILHAAAKEFAQVGYEGASINRILLAAGLSKGAFYYYFDDKADLAATVLAGEARAWLETFHALAVPNTPEEFWDGMERINERVMTQLARSPRHADLIRFALRQFTDDLRDLTLFRLDVAKVNRLKVRGWKEPMAKEPQTYQFVKKDGNWAVESPAGKTADPAKVAALVNALAAPRADSYTGGGPKGEHGIDVGTNPEGLEFTIEQEGAQPVVLILGNKTADPAKVYGISSAVPNTEVFVLPVGTIKALAERGPVTLMCHCDEDAAQCHRHILRELILSNRV